MPIVKLAINCVVKLLIIYSHETASNFIAGDAYGYGGIGYGPAPVNEQQYAGAEATVQCVAINRRTKTKTGDPDPSRKNAVLFESERIE